MPQREESFTHELRHVCMRSTRAFTHVQCSISQVHAQSENHAKTREVWTSCIQVPRARILTIKSHVWFPHEKPRIAAQVARSIHESPTCTGHRSQVTPAHAHSGDDVCTNSGQLQRQLTNLFAQWSTFLAHKLTIMPRKVSMAWAVSWQLHQHRQAAVRIQEVLLPAVLISVWRGFSPLPLLSLPPNPTYMVHKASKPLLSHIILLIRNFSFWKP